MGALAVRQPVGVVTCVTSYNNPWANPAGKIAPALAMGNTVVVKPAPQDPLSVYRMAEALEAAGVPPGVVNVVSGSRTQVGEAAVESPDVDMVSFTGSTAVGQRIAEVCGRGMKRQLMELGGKGAALVFDDADLGSAVAGIGTHLLLLQRPDLHGTDAGAGAARGVRPAGRATGRDMRGG